MSPIRVLVAGASGYLGQFVARDLASNPTAFEVAVTYGRFTPSIAGVDRAYPLDAEADDATSAVAAIMDGFRPDVVVNCIAQSDLGVSEKQPAAAARLNVPAWLVDALPRDCCFIHLSTDIVYNGQAPHCCEEQADPICAYGRTKLAGEQYIIKHHPNHVILRSALIYGPTPFLGTSKSSFIQATANGIRERKRIGVFSDEFRTPAYVLDIVRVVSALASGHQGLDWSGGRIFNMGGPERCSRHDMARMVCQVVGDGEDLLDVKLASSIDFGYRRPLDVSMDSSRLRQLLPSVPFTPMAQAIAEVLSAERVSSL